MTEPIEVRYSKGKALLLLLLAAVFAAGGVGMGLTARSQSDRLVGWCVAGFLGLGGAVAASRRLTNKPQIILSAEGFQDMRGNQKLIPWSQISSVGVARMRQSKYLCIELRDPKMFFPTGQGQGTGLTNALGLGHVQCSLGGLDRSPENIASEVSARLSREG